MAEAEERTHARLLVGYLANVVGVSLALAAAMALIAALTSRELGVFFAGFAGLIAFVGMAQGHVRACAAATMRPGSEPGIAPVVVPWLGLALVAGTAGALGPAVPPTLLGRLSAGVFALGLVWALFRGCAAIRRAGEGAAADG